jgi:flagellar FliL protein
VTTPTIPRPGKAEDDAKDGGGNLAGKKGKKGAKDGGPASRKKKVIILGVVVLALAAAYLFVLKLSMALQFTATASTGGHGGDEPDGSKALDLAIAQLSNRKIAELNTAAARDAAKKKLLTAIEEAYDHDVMNLYFTEFVMQ